MENNTTTLSVAVAGLGAIGKIVAQALDQGDIPGCKLAAVSGRDAARTAAFVNGLSSPVPAVALEKLVEHADIVVECAPAALLRQIVEPVLKAGKTAVVLSVGALLQYPELTDPSLSGRGGRILVPSGAALGLDAIAAAAEGHIESVRMITRKPPMGFKGAPLLAEKNIDIDKLTEPLKLFEGTARQAARDFPANLNVAVALSLAGIGPDKTYLEVWADPGVTRNTHSIKVVADSAVLQMTIENIPSENPRSSRITALSVIALLRKLSARVRVGT
ncbi:aspartate dehydrogenase [Alcaligenaceae bacterium]|nr:aspartate dehydrogenase [Alcaligenaceae bacterium]